MRRIKRKVCMVCMACLLALLPVGCGTGSREPEGQTGVLKTFTAKTLDGSAFTQDDLAKSDVTVFNFWALSCGPCIAEMPDLAAYEQSLPEHVKLVTVCLDGAGDKESVKNVLQEAGYEGTTLVSGNGDFEKLCGAIMYTPTTVVIDKDGNILGDAIVGGQKNLGKTYTDAVNHALKSLGKEEI